jgi:cobalt-zinc-cadmium efflux system membrane fusion protein
MKTTNLNIVWLVILLFSCSKPAEVTEAAHDDHEEETGVELTARQMETAGITWGRVESRVISGVVQANGILDVPPQQLVSVSAPLGGFLKQTDLLQGTRVKKGQRIAVMENPEYIQLQQDYLEAKSQFELTLAEYERQQTLAQESVSAQKTLQQAKSQYQVWQARKNGLAEKLRLINIDIQKLEAGTISSTVPVYAPINGYVTEINVNIGKFVNPTDVLFEIVDTEHLHAELIIFERDVPRIQVGQKVRFTLANEHRDRMAEVFLIGREIGVDRTIRIHCHIDQEDKELVPGMYLKALVETSSSSVPSLPEEAIVEFQGEKYIFVEAPAEGEHADEEESTHFTMLPVSTGNTELGYTEVILPPDWKMDTPVIVKGAYAILSKMKNSEEEGHAH